MDSSISYLVQLYLDLIHQNPDQLRITIAWASAIILFLWIYFGSSRFVPDLEKFGGAIIFAATLAAFHMSGLLHMHPLAPLLAASVLLAFYYSFVFFRSSRQIADTPTSNVRSASQGYVELAGIARQLEDNPISCPLTKESCVWWTYKVEQRAGHKKWAVIATDTSAEPFMLEDDTGRCVVNPAGAEMVLSAVYKRWVGRTPWPYEKSPTGLRWLFASTYRYTEHLILPGTSLYALGLFRTRSMVMDPAEVEAELGRQLEEWKQAPERMEQLDTDRDGEVSEKEWQAARATAFQELQQRQMEIGSEGLHTLSRPEIKGQPFLLSTIPQKALRRRRLLHAALCFAWFVFGGALFVWQLVIAGLLS